MSTRQHPEFGTFRCSGSSVHSRFLGPGVIPKTLWNCVCVTVTLGIMAASGFSQPSPAEKYHYHALWLLLFKIRSSLSQSSAKPHEWTLRTSKSILRLLDHWGRQSNQRSIFNMYLGIKLLYPPKNGGIIYISQFWDDSNFHPIQSCPMYYMKHWTHMEASWDWGVNNKHRSFMQLCFH